MTSVCRDYRSRPVNLVTIRSLLLILDVSSLKTEAQSGMPQPRHHLRQLRQTTSTVNCALATSTQLNCTSSTGQQFILTRKVGAV